MSNYQLNSFFFRYVTPRSEGEKKICSKLDEDLRTACSFLCSEIPLHSRGPLAKAYIKWSIICSMASTYYFTVCAANFPHLRFDKLSL